MAKPTILKITPFDATSDYIVDLYWLGNRAYKNRLIIYDNDTNDIVYDNTIETYLLKHTIPANTLTNGHSWVMQAQIIDGEDNVSVLSDRVMFYTLTTPEFYFNNIPTNNKLTTASFEATVYHNSIDWDDVESYQFSLYDSTQRLLLESEILNESTISYVYRGLDNNTDYYFRCVAKTKMGMSLDTGLIHVSVYYENPNAYARIYATNLPDQGCVQVATNLIIIQYNGTEEFTYENGMIDLRDKTLYYDEGFLIEDDFTLILRGINLWQTAELLRMNNDKHGLSLSSHIYSDGTLRFKLLVPNGVSNYLLYSEPQVFNDTDIVSIIIRRKNNIYRIQVFLEIGFSTEGDMWFGTLRPANAQQNDRWIDLDGETVFVDKDTMITYIEDEEPVNAKLYDVWFGE